MWQITKFFFDLHCKYATTTMIIYSGIQIKGLLLLENTSIGKIRQPSPQFHTHEIYKLFIWVVSIIQHASIYFSMQMQINKRHIIFIGKGHICGVWNLSMPMRGNIYPSTHMAFSFPVMYCVALV
jgi:hypothetical protein